MLIATVGVFVLTALVSVVIGLGAWDVRSQTLDRLASPRAAVADVVSSPATVWRELVKRIGTAVPASTGELSLLKRRLIRAGFRNPSAAGYFHGIRMVTAVVFTAIGLLIALRVGAAAEKLILVPAAFGAFGFIAPAQVLSFRISKRKHAVERGLANALDLMVVCVESGLGIDQALMQVAKELQYAHPEICDEFTVMNLELRAGQKRHDALHHLADRTGVDDIKKLVAVLVQTDRFGTSIAQALRGHSEFLRTMARQRAEERAAKLAVKLVFPIFFCVLPSLFVVTVGPVMTHMIRDLIPMIENM